VPDAHSQLSTQCVTFQEAKYYVQQGIQARRHLIDISAMTMKDKDIKTQDDKKAAQSVRTKRLLSVYDILIS
jgi:hypothetical protein